MFHLAPGETLQVNAETLAEWLSPFVVRRFTSNPTPIASAEEQKVTAAILFVDVCGFTRLTDELARQGAPGMEVLSGLINTGFGRLVERIHHWGGEIARFPGDAILALWTARDGDPDLATRRAAACGLELVSSPFAEIPADVVLKRPPRSGADPRALYLRGGLAVGDVTMAHVGGILGRWEFLLMGEPFVAVGRAAEQAGPQQLVVDPAAWTRLGASAQCARSERGPRLLEAIWGVSPGARRGPVKLDEISTPLVRGYVPRALLAKLEANPHEWLGEIRPVTALFIKLYTTGPDADAPVPLLDRALRLLQSNLYRFEGAIDKLNVDEKGLTILAALGLPPFCHENDAARGVAAALAIHGAMRELELGCSIGVATGRVFCGPLGGEGRREYTMVGSVINLAARLMMDPEAGVLTDLETSRRASRRNAFLELEPRIYGGFERPRRVFRPDPAWISSRNVRVWQEEEETEIEGRRPMVGRSREIAYFEGLLGALAERGERLVALRGGPGIGKTTLAHRLLDIARRRAVRVVTGAAEEILSKSPYHAWQATLGDLLDLGPDADRDLARARALRSLSSIPDVSVLAPLIEAILPLGIADNETTALLSGAVRRDNLHELVVRVVRRAAEEAPFLLVLEDVHWMDAASWALLDAVNRGTQDLGVAIVVTLRPFPVPTAPETDRLLSVARVLDLPPLTMEETAELLRLRARAPRIAREVVEFVAERAQGNPLFCEELLHVLQETGRVEVRNSVFRLAEKASLGGVLPLSDSVNGLILNRIDNLPPALQLTLKAASVIGREFDLEMLAAIHPARRARDLLSQDLEALVARDLLRLVEDSLGESYFFKHVLTRDAAYAALLPSQRQTLHRSIALRLEEPLTALSCRPSLLLDHWRQAGDPQRAVPHADRVASLALRQANYDEAIACFHWLLDDAATSGVVAPREGGRARWLALLGEAEAAAGLPASARSTLELALHLRGRPIHTRNPGLLLSILRETAVQAWRRLRWRLAIPDALDPDETLGESAVVCEQLGFVYYAEMQTLLGVQAALKMLNLAERRGPCPALARAYAATALTFSVVPWQAAADVYEKLSLSLVDRLGDPLTGAHVHWVRGIRNVGIGRWEPAEQACRLSIEAAERFGDRRILTSALQTLQSLAAYTGRLDESLALGNRQIELAHDSGENALWEAWARNGLGEAMLALGRFEEAEEESRKALALLTGGAVADKGDQIRAEGILALALLRRDRVDEALSQARAALALIQDVELTAWSALEGYLGVADVLLTAAEAGREIPRAEMKRAFKAADNFTRVFPIAAPRRLRLRARLANLGEGPSRALLREPGGEGS